MEIFGTLASVGFVLAVYIGVRQWGHLRFKKAFEAAQGALQVRDFPVAETHLKKCVKIAPLAVPLRTMLGGVLARNQKLTEAEEHMKMAADLQPRNAESQLLLGVFYASVFSDREDAAFLALERAVELDPNIRGRMAQQEGLDAIRDSTRFRELVA